MLDPTRNRHGLDTESQAAWESIKDSVNDTALEILAEIELAGDDGRACFEIAAARHVSPNRISGRFTELKVRGFIECAGKHVSEETNCTGKAYKITAKGRAALERRLAQL